MKKVFLDTNILLDYGLEYERQALRMSYWKWGSKAS